MSHLTTVKLRLVDLDAVESVAPTCGLELRRGQGTFLAYQGRTKCSHALRQVAQPTGYEVGLVKAVGDDVGFDVQYDDWGQQGRALPDAVRKLKREYAAAVATKKAVAVLSRKGFRVQREDVGNRIRLRLRAR